VIRALVFDFDGPILDTAGQECHAWQEIFGERGTDLAIDLRCECIGRPADWLDLSKADRCPGSLAEMPPAELLGRIGVHA
jgi:beta-phosphoglucomutase-like phosphatase (HAD superfamily)